MVNRLLFALFALAPFAAQKVAAQPFAAPSPNEALAGAICGTARTRAVDYATAVANTATRSPELYRRALAEAKGGASRLLDEQESTFWALDHVTQSFIQVRAVRVHLGRLARVWVDVRDTARTDLKAKLPILIAALEDSTAPGSRDPGKGIIENDVDVFGPTPTSVGDGYQDFLLFDISDQGILGFFAPIDQMDEEFSNRRNLLYIDSREGLMRTSSILNTLAHEFQHLIHYGVNSSADLFLNEGCSETAGLMCGYPDRTNQNYLRNTNSSLFQVPSDPTGMNLAYERALTFVHYLYEQHGDGFLHALPRTHMWGMSAVDSALSQVVPGLRWDVAGRGFAVANWLQTNDDPRYSYKVSVTSTFQRQARPLRTYSVGSMRIHDTVTLQPYGIGYVAYESPTQLTMKFKGRYRYRVLAITHQGEQVEVKDFEPGELVDIGGTAYDRVVLILMELSNASQKITWDLNEGISAIDDDASASSLRFVGVTPNPARDRGDIAFSTPGGAAITLELYSPRGEVVRTVVAGERLEAGTHHVMVDLTGLPAGAYLARLSDGAKAATHLVIVQ